MCHTRGRGGQCSSKETIHSDGKAREPCPHQWHISRGGPTVEEEFQRGG